MSLPINLVPDAVQTSAGWRHIPWSRNRQLLPLANHALLMRSAMAMPSPNEFRQNGLCNLQNRALNIGTSGFEVTLLAKNLKGFRRNAVPPIVAARRSNSSAAVARTPLNGLSRGSATKLPRAHLRFFFNGAQSLNYSCPSCGRRHSE